MSKRVQALCLLFPLGMVEATAYQKLEVYLSWGTEGLLAYVSALAFICLLLGGIVALSQDLSVGMRRYILIGGVLLFMIQGLANVLISYQYALVALPVEIPMEFFDIDRRTALMSTALIQGLVLSGVSIAFWRTIAIMLSQHLEEVKQQKTMLSQIEDYLNEEATATA